LKGLEKSDDTASRFGISESNVRLIQAGKTWRSSARRVFTRDEVLHIRATPHTIKSAGAFAKELGVGRSVIDRIREGKTYRWIEPSAADGGKP
jgi:hypothetical protein